MSDQTHWLARFGEPGCADGVALVASAADGGPPARIVDPVPSGSSRLLGRWRLVERDDAAREARYEPDVR